jgi:hypothetical protein
MIRWIGSQLGVEAQCWPQYASRGQTRREHLVELRAYLGLRPFCALTKGHWWPLRASGSGGC